MAKKVQFEKGDVIRVKGGHGGPFVVGMGRDELGNSWYPIRPENYEKIGVVKLDPPKPAVGQKWQYVGTISKGQTATIVWMGRGKQPPSAQKDYMLIQYESGSLFLVEKDGWFDNRELVS